MKCTHYAAVCAILALGACTKEKKTTSCTPMMYGFVTPGTTPWAPPASAFFSHIDVPTMTGPSLGTVADSGYSNQATFNTSDNCYYFFKSRAGSATSKLFKFTMGGSVTEFTNAGGLQYTNALVYNPVSNKLYCLLGDASTTASVAEVVISGTSYTINPVATASGIAHWVSPPTSTVNSSMGEMYFAMNNVTTSNYSVEEYHPGAGSTSVVTAGTGIRVMGLRFNSNDNTLYALTESSSFNDQFVKISGGTITTLSTLPFPVNNEFYSTTFDRCSNRYILSTVTGSGWTSNIVAQINTSGTIVQTDTTAGLYQGLDILY